MVMQGTFVRRISLSRATVETSRLHSNPLLTGFNE